ncbi:MAG: glycosyltransferase family 9 protein [Mucilaginibacter sp.]
MRPDNMGDLIMTGPAIRSLKETFSARITVLTSSMAAGIAAFIPEIDDVIVFDLPWVKTKEASRDQIPEIVQIIRERHFDAAVIFTVYSQNPLPTAMLAYMAGIPKVLAYCRENPYGLLTNWIPDPEPYQLIKHQVRRDLDLVKHIGAVPSCEQLRLKVSDSLWPTVTQKLALAGINTDRPWIIFHPGVSEKKRQYPVENWISAGRLIVEELGYQLVLTGTSSELMLTRQITDGIGSESSTIAGQLNLAELVCLIKHVPLMVAVNTGTVHISAAVNTPVVVLYAQTNPQHTPWKASCKVLQFAAEADLKSKNEVIAYVDQQLYAVPPEMPQPNDVLNAVQALLFPDGSASPQFHGIQGGNPARQAS